VFCFYSCIQYFSIYFSEKACELNFKLLAEKAIEYNYGPWFVAVGDLNNDSILDLVIAQQIVNKITVYLGEGNGNFRHRIEHSTGIHSSPCMIQLGHFNNDSQLDIAVANFGSNNIALFYGFGNGSFEQPIQFSTNSSRPIVIFTADFDNDTLFDLVTANYGTNSITIHCAHTNFQSSLTYSTGSTLPYAIALGDFNEDHQLDIIVVGQGPNNIVLFLANGNGHLKSPRLF